MLQEAREMLITNGQEIATDGSFCLTEKQEGLNYLQIDNFDKQFYLGIKSNLDTEITLPELEQILKEKNT